MRRIPTSPTGSTGATTTSSNPMASLLMISLVFNIKVSCTAQVTLTNGDIGVNAIWCVYAVSCTELSTAPVSFSHGGGDYPVGGQRLRRTSLRPDLNGVPYVKDLFDRCERHTICARYRPTVGEVRCAISIDLTNGDVDPAAYADRGWAVYRIWCCSVFTILSANDADDTLCGPELTNELRHPLSEFASCSGRWTNGLKSALVSAMCHGRA